MCDGLVDGQPVSIGDGKFTVYNRFDVLCIFVSYYVVVIKPPSCRIVTSALITLVI
jgi:hypothetical protein